MSDTADVLLSAPLILGDIGKCSEILREAILSRFGAFVEAIKRLGNIDYKKLNQEDRRRLLDLRGRYSTLLKDITAMCNNSIRQLNKMMRAKRKEDLRDGLARFNWDDYHSLISTTQMLQGDVSLFRVECEKYKEQESFFMHLCLTLAAATATVAAGLALLAAAPVLLTVALAGACAASAVVTLTCATVTLNEWNKRQESAEITRLQNTLNQVEKHLSGIAQQQNGIVDLQDDYDDDELASMKDAVHKLKDEITSLRNLASKEITF